MKNTAMALAMMACLLCARGAGAELPDIAALCSAEDITPISAQTCAVTLPLRDGINTIASSGAYRVQGSCTGQLVVDAKDAWVFLYLDGVSIASTDGPAVHIKAADKVIITLAEGTENTLTDGEVYTLAPGEDEPNGALFSRADLSINGAGSLRVTARHDDGIVSKDSLVIADADIVVDSKGDAIRGKDSVLLYRASITAEAGNDGVKSTNAEDEGRGWMYIVDSILTIDAQHDGVQAETALYIGGGTYNIVSGGGCLPEYRQEFAAPVRKADRARIAQEDEAQEDVAQADAESGKGIKAAGIQIASGTFVIDSRDDALHADGSIAIEDGYFELASNDDGIHADDTFELTGGHILISESFEGIEAAHILLRGGKTDVTAIDDGWNAASKAAEAEGGGRKKSHAYDITVSGGEHAILAGADAIDSNGSILISGGVTLASTGNEMKEVALDYPEVCACTITGGIFAASGGYGKNTQTFNQTENQAAVTLKWREQQSAGTAVTLLAGGEAFLTFAPKAAFKSIIVSAPDVQTGTVLTVRTGQGQACSREIDEAVMLFPVTASRRAASPAPESEPAAQAAATSPYGAMVEQSASADGLGYLLYTPDGAGEDELALIVYLHGGSGKGDDLSCITAAEGFPKYLQEGQLGDVRAYVLMPQCPEAQNGWQSVSDRLFAVIDDVCANWPIDSGRVILTGHSMGGTGTWALAAMQPGRFARIAPMSGSIDITEANVQALSAMPVWAFAAKDDRVVDPASTVDFLARLGEANPEARLTVFGGAQHRDVPALAWLDEGLGLLDWMLSP